jgi:hypothetical protein
VTTTAGSATVTGGYTYSPPPTITSVNATSGVVQGGTKVTISGTNFGTTGAPVVKIGGKLALCTKLVNPSTITAVTRPGVAGAVDVEVAATTGAGTVVLPSSYTYQDPATLPALTTVTPNSGTTAGGNTIDIAFTDVIPSDIPTVLIGQLCASAVTRVNDHTIRATMPASVAGAKNVALTWATAYAVANLGYTYVAPVVSQILWLLLTVVTPWVASRSLFLATALTAQALQQSPSMVSRQQNVTFVKRKSDHRNRSRLAAAGAKTVSVTPGGKSAITLPNA